MTFEPTITLQSHSQPSQKRRLLSLQELKEKNAGKIPVTPQKSKPSPPLKPKRSLWIRVCLWCVSTILSLVLILGAGLVYLTSPIAEEVLTNLIEDGVNYLGKPMGLRIQLVGIRGFWEGKIHLYDLRVYDAYGPWLRVDEGTLHPQWKSLARSSVATWNYRHNKEIPQGLLRNNAPLSTLPEVHSGSFVNDGEATPSQVNSEQHDPSIDIVDSLLTAEKTLENTAVIGLKLGTLVGVYMPRFPRYQMAESETPPDTELTFLPSWLALDIGEIDIAEFQLGPNGRSIMLSGRMHGQISQKKIRLRTTILAAQEISTQWVLPAVQELPADITLTIKQLNNIAQGLAQNLSPRDASLKDQEYTLGFFSFDYDEGDIDLRWQSRDSFFTPRYLQGAKSVWSRSRILGKVKTWPPTPNNPLQLRFVNRFGMRLEQEGQRVRASLAAGQLFWDGTTFVLRDLDVRSPVKNTSFTAKGSLGVSPTDGFGTQLSVSINDIKTLASVLGVDLQKFPISGLLNADFYVSRGGEYLLWWAKPLPDFQQGRGLPGFTASPHDYSRIAKNVQNYSKNVLSSVKIVHDAYVMQGFIQPQTPKDEEATASAKSDSTQEAAVPTALDKAKESIEVIAHAPLPPASQNDEALRFRLKLEIPQLEIQQGKINSIFFTIHGNSADTQKMPNGTAYPRKEKPEKTTDFTASGLPRGLVGSTFLRLGDIFGMGKGTLSGTWFVGGAHDESDVFQARLNKLDMVLPGMSSFADLSFAYALPRLKRRWPWVDGNISVQIENWDFMERVARTPVRVENFALASAFKSFLDDNGDPAQYMNINFHTDRVDATQFMVRETSGKSESKHLHALADTVGLSIGKLRDALTRKMEYTPPKDYPIFTANLDLSSGRGGPVRWNHGSAKMLVAGEDANFDVSMLGDINALLEGLFNFRTRTLKLKDMKISTPAKEKK